MTVARPPGSARVVGLLLVAARRRAAGRRSRARDIIRSQAGQTGTGRLGLGSLLSTIVAIGLTVLSALLVQEAVRAGQRIDATRSGQVLVGEDFMILVRAAQRTTPDQASSWAETDAALWNSYAAEAARLARNGGDAAGIARRLRGVVLAHQTDRFVTEQDAAEGLAGLRDRGAGALLGFVALAWWTVMLVMHGEELELDTQRRRHPMWEWVLSHPVRPAALFCAEMLAPLAANPMLWSAPLMPGILFGFVYGPALGLLAAFMVGIPVAVAAACLGKAVEIAAMLRLSPRSRGAVLGLMGWLGYTTSSLTFLAWWFIDPLTTALAGPLGLLGELPWPWLALALGRLRPGPSSFPAGATVCCLVASSVAVLSVVLSVWGAMRGLGGRSETLAPGRPAGSGRTRFGRNPVHRKEWLWFARDRSAVVQVVLVPLSLAGMQLFDMRGLIADAGGAWNAVCGTAILFGTYFLIVVGPKSLASEGTALWIAMTWPDGLETLLRAKARLWTVVSSGFVALPLLYAACRFPSDLPGVVLVGIGWIVFGYGMALKTVTLVTVAGSSGEAGKIPASRRWATYLGTLTFSVGVLTRQWPVAISGIVYSSLTSAAMWQNFRARLPYLFDPWSERRPEPPTLMHAMVAIAALVEGGAVLTGLARAFGGAGWATGAYATGYALSAAIVGIGVVCFLKKRQVRTAAVWCWDAVPSRPGSAGSRRLFLFLAIGGIAGAALGGLGHLYLLGLRQFAWLRAVLEQADPLTTLPHYRQWSFALAVFVAPPAEEFLFRGLLYRALDREWGGWAAIGGSAAFFAIYHPVLAWLPVGVLGASNAVLFRKSGYLAPAVLLHMVYNAVVLL